MLRHMTAKEPYSEILVSNGVVKSYIVSLDGRFEDEDVERRRLEGLRISK